MKPVLAILLAAVLVFGIVAVSFLQFSGFDIIKYSGAPKYEDAWWNASWHYRMKIEVNTSDLARTDWREDFREVKL